MKKNPNVFLYGKRNTPLSSNCYGCYHFGTICEGSVYSGGSCGANEISKKETISAMLSIFVLKKLNKNLAAFEIFLTGDVRSEPFNEGERREAEATPEDYYENLRKIVHFNEYFLQTEEEVMEQRGEYFENKSVLDVMRGIINEYYGNPWAFSVLNYEMTLEEYNQKTNQTLSEEQLEQLRGEFDLNEFRYSKSNKERKEREENMKKMGGESFFPNSKSKMDEDPFAELDKRKTSVDVDDLPF